MNERIKEKLKSESCKWQQNQPKVFNSIPIE